MDSNALNACEDGDLRELSINPKKIISLDMLPQNEEAIIIRIISGENALTRLCHLGMTPGAIVRKIASAPFHGPIEIRVRDTLLALGRGLASKILVILKRDANKGEK